MGARTTPVNSPDKEIQSVDFMEQAASGRIDDPYADDAIDYEMLQHGARPVEAISEREFNNVKEMEAFMQEKIVIIVHKSTDKNASPRVPVGLNGERIWLPRDVKIRIPRRLVGVLAQSQEVTFSTDDNPDPRADEGKIIHKRKGQPTPFAVLHDPNPRGARWLQRVMREG